MATLSASISSVHNCNLASRFENIPESRHFEFRDTFRISYFDHATMRLIRRFDSWSVRNGGSCGGPRGHARPANFASSAGFAWLRYSAAAIRECPFAL